MDPKNSCLFRDPDLAVILLSGIIGGLPAGSCLHTPKCPDVVVICASGGIRMDALTLDSSAGECLVVDTHRGTIETTLPSEDFRIHSRYAECPVLFFPDAVIVPGWTDGHSHILQWLLENAHEAPEVPSCKQFLNWLATLSFNRGDWIYVRGWDESLWTDSFCLHPTTLERIPSLKGKKILLVRVDGHSAVLSSTALKWMQSHVPDTLLPLFHHQLDSVSGKISEQLLHWLRLHGLPPPDGNQLNLRWQKLRDSLLLYGIVGWTEMGFPTPWLPTLQVFLENLHPQPHICMFLDGNTWHPDAEQKPDTLLTGSFFVAGIKLYLDGSLGSRTACLRHDRNGICWMDATELRQWFSRTLPYGHSLALHAIGDSAVMIFLHAWKAFVHQQDPPSQDISPSTILRLEHLQVVPPELFAWWDSARNISNISLIPSVQPCHWRTDSRWLFSRIPPDYPGHLYPYRLLCENTLCAMGTDFPVEPLNPFRNWLPPAIADDSLRVIDERIWFRASTLGNLKACGKDFVPARIEPGAPATFTIVRYTPDSRKILFSQVVAVSWKSILMDAHTGEVLVP